MKQLKKHHTVADWDWNTLKNATLSTDHYVSPPTCLKIGIPDGAGMMTYWLCRHPDTLNLPEGRIDWYSHHTPFVGAPAHIMFRNQEPLGNVTITFCYHIEFGLNTGTIRRRNGLDIELLATFDYTRRNNQWCHYRASWYNGFNGDGLPALVIELEEEVEGVWQAIWPPVYDTVNAFADSDINRVGQHQTGLEEYPTYHDDTSIYRKVG